MRLHRDDQRAVRGLRPSVSGRTRQVADIRQRRPGARVATRWPGAVFHCRQYPDACERLDRWPVCGGPSRAALRAPDSPPDRFASRALRGRSRWPEIPDRRVWAWSCNTYRSVRPELAVRIQPCRTQARRL